MKAQSILVSVAVVAALVGVVVAQSEPTLAGVGLSTKESSMSVKDAMDKVEAIVRERGFNVVARVDHAAGAASVDLDLRPTELLIFGNPAGGTLLMQEQQSIAIDLPMKFAAWENEDGQTIVAYNDPQFLAERHGIVGNDMVLQNMAMLASNLSAEVA